MQALVYTDIQKLIYREEKNPKLLKGESIIKVSASGICGSDMHAYHGHDNRRIPPLILGHEVSGVINKGKDITVITYGLGVIWMKEIIDTLEQDISIELIDLRSVRPIDYESIINSVKKTNRLVIIEEAWPLASISSEISHHVQRFAFDYLDAPVHRITCEDVPFHYAPTLIKEITPNVDKAMKAVKSVMYK